MKEILLILLLQLLYVPLLTLRTIFLVKNITYLASIFGFAEMLVYVFGLGLVFSGDQTILAMIVYAVGFGIGIILGTKTEQKLAVGYVLVTIIIPSKNMELIDTLRKNGFGVTMYTGEGRDGNRYKLDILAKRSKEKKLNDIVLEFVPDAFIISYEPRYFRGGFLV